MSRGDGASQAVTWRGPHRGTYAVRPATPSLYDKANPNHQASGVTQNRP